MKITPMKAVLTDKPFDSKDWFFELKWDGVRAIAYIDNGEVSLLSRNQIKQNSRYPELANINDFVLADNVVLDGEIVAFDEDGLPSFEALQSHKTPVVYYVFDVLYLNGQDLTGEPLWKRKKILTSIIKPDQHIQISEYIAGEGKIFFEIVKDRGLEGIIAKNKHSLYKQKRTKDWLKIKAVLSQEVVIGGYTQPKGTRTYFGALLIGVYKNSDFIYVGHVGSGFSDATLKKLHKKMASLEQPKAPFKDIPKTNEKAHWLKPQLVAQIKFSEWTKAGVMRQPVFQGLRNDVDPKEVTREWTMSE